MSKKKVVDRVAEVLKGEIRKRDIKTVVDTTFNSIGDLLLEGERLNLYGLGAFEMKTRKARKARNPQTGEMIEIPPRKHVRFKVSMGLKERLLKFED